MTSVVEVAAGEFDIGDELIPNASPRHRRRIGESIWIDAAPITWAHFESFVVAGGYRRADLWVDATGTPFPWSRDETVDSRCREVLGLARGQHTQLLRSQLGLDKPLTGINWFEASAIARFYHARLPFEVEWEVAMRQSRSSSKTRPSESPLGDLNRCHSFVGTLQEWTGDAFSSKYWRSDFGSTGVPWSASAASDAAVVVRGASADDLVQDVCFRRGESPAAGYPLRTFRRVWDQRPTAQAIEPIWRSYAKA